MTSQNGSNEARWGSRFWLCWTVGFSLLIATLLLSKSRALPRFGFQEAGLDQAITQVSTHERASGEHLLNSRRIEDVRVGDRVMTDNPTEEYDFTLGEEVVPAAWRKLVLRAHKKDGSWCDIELLRPLHWMEEGSRARMIQAGSVKLSVPECGIQGHAQLMSVDSCPPIRPGFGRVVTGTFRHSSAQIVDVYALGLSSPIGTTRNHLFWSDDRKVFVPAIELRAGERLRSVAGPLVVQSVKARSGNASVYNLEVQVDHTYLVSASGVLVHNAGNVIPLLPDNLGLTSGTNKGNGTSVIYVIQGTLGGEEQFYVGQASFRERLRSDPYGARTLLLEGENVTVSVRTIDYSGIDEIMKAHNIDREEAIRRITRTAEYNALEAAKAQYNIKGNGESATVNGKTYRNINKGGRGEVIGTSVNAEKPQEYTRTYGSTKDGKSRLSEVVETIRVCPK